MAHQINRSSDECYIGRDGLFSNQRSSYLENVLSPVHFSSTTDTDFKFLMATSDQLDSLSLSFQVFDGNY